jgi:hypothetical protein
VLLADPNVPAGVDPAAAPLRPPAGRRGRLRRRLRYLRRARELMLRDLGGLLYEVHRTGGGDVAAHATIVDAKVQRIAGLDQEAHALEAALASPRAETVLFQPGVGGTCGHCGALFPSEARFCAACGTSVDAAVSTPVTGEAAVAEPAAAPPAVPRGRRFWQRRKVPPMPVSGEAAADAPADDATAVLAPGGDGEPAPADAPAASKASAEQPAAADATPEQPTAGASEEQPAAADATTEQPAADAPAEPPEEQSPAADAPAEEQPAAEEHPADAADGATEEQPAVKDATGQPPADGDAPRNPFTGMGNGRAEDQTPPGLSSGDPLVTRRTGT